MNHIHLLSKKKISSIALTCLNLLDQVAIKTNKHISAAPASPTAGTGWLATILMYQREEPADQSAGSGGLRESVGELLSPPARLSSLLALVWRIRAAYETPVGKYESNTLFPQRKPGRHPVEAENNSCRFFLATCRSAGLSRAVLLKSHTCNWELRWDGP